MAGNQLKASTVLEVVIAMVIMMAVFTIALMIFGNVQRLSLSAKKVRAQAILEEALVQAEKAPEISTRSFNVGDIRVEEVIGSYNGTAGLLLVELSAFDANQERIVQVREVLNEGK